MEIKAVCVEQGEDIFKLVEHILRGDGDQPDVVVHFGPNDMGRMGEEVLQREIKELGSWFKKKHRIPAL